MTMQFPVDGAAPLTDPQGAATQSAWVPPPLINEVAQPRHWWTEHRATALILVYTTLAILLALPVMTAEVPLGADDLNHLARIYVRAHLDSDPDLARFFRPRSDITPYLGMDLLLTPLARVLPIMLVGRLYILALVLGLVCSVVVLQRVFTGRIGFEPAAAGIFAYNGLLAWGLINYILGIIFALLLFAAWHSLRGRFWLTRLLLFTCAATLLYLTHLLAFVLYGILVASHEILSRPKPLQTPFRDWMVLVGQAVPSLILWSEVSDNLTGGGFSVYYATVSKIFALGSPFLFDSAAGGAGGLISLGIIYCIAFILYMSSARGWFTWHTALVGPVWVLLGLTIIMPFEALGVAMIDQRFALPAACLAAAALRINPLVVPRALPAIVGIALLTVSHVADVSAVMHRCDTQYAELRNALAALPRGVELTTVLERTDPVPGTACTSLPIYAHIAQLVTIDRSGFAPDFFAIVTPMALRPGLKGDTDPASADTFTAGPPGGYVLWIHLGKHRQPPPGFVLLRAGSFFDLWSVRA